MISFRINPSEQEALTGLLPLHQVLYVLGLRPHMDFATGLVGVRRRISYQSLMETLYVEPHCGYRSGTPSRDQIRRGLLRLEDVGLLERRYDQDVLIFYCPKAMGDSSVQKQVATKPPPQAATPEGGKKVEETATYKPFHRQAATPKRAQAATPLVTGNKLTTHTQDAREETPEALEVRKLHGVQKPENPEKPEAVRKTTSRENAHWPDNETTRVLWEYEPDVAVLRTATRLGCAGAQPAREPVERARFVSYHRGRGTRRYDWNAEYLGWLLRTPAAGIPAAGIPAAGIAATGALVSPTTGVRRCRQTASQRSNVSRTAGGAMNRVLMANRDLLAVNADAQTDVDIHSPHPLKPDTLNPSRRFA